MLFLFYLNLSEAATPALDITDTDIIQLPVDFFLAGSDPDIRKLRDTRETFGGKSGSRRVASQGGSMLRPKPSFSVTTSKKGYE